MKKIRLQNFRCFADQQIPFKKGVNLLVGDNASGKTSVLKACKYVLSSFFSGFSDENTKWINPDVDDFRIVMTSDGILLPEQPIHIEFNVDDFDFLIHPVATFFEDDCRYVLTKNSKKNSRSLIMGIKEYRDYAASLMQEYIVERGQVKALPLFAFFSTEDIHSKRKINANKFKAYHVKPSFGYYECLDGDGFFSYWTKRLLVLQEKNETHPEIDLVRDAIYMALGEEGCNIIQEMHIRPNQKKVYYTLVDGREVEADYLSDGYRRLVNIVTDIAFRCALLNRGIYREEACSRTKGTVLIDEVDLHLHPTLQSKILMGLRRAFPEIQFIVTSHAPMVMSGVENNDENVVYKLEYSIAEGYRVFSVDTYGLDLSTLTTIILGQTPRVVEVENELSTLFDWIDEERYDEAKEKLLHLKERFRDHLPELAEAEAMLDCVIEEGDEEN